jgi:hypothetical protein
MAGMKESMMYAKKIQPHPGLDRHNNEAIRDFFSARA